MIPDYWCLFSLFTIGMVVRSGYECLKRSGKIRAENRPVFALVALTMLILWLSWFIMCTSDPRPLVLLGIVKWAGLGIVILGWCLAVGALLQLRGVDNIDHLITGGLFARLRHPMYTGFMLWILGWLLYQAAGISIIAGTFGIGNIFYWRWVEEDALEKRYGDDYRRYREGTWF